MKKPTCITYLTAMIFLIAGCATESHQAYEKSSAMSSCKPCEKFDGFIEPFQIDDEIRKMVGKYRGGAGAENVAIQKKRGVIETIHPSATDVTAVNRYIGPDGRSDWENSQYREDGEKSTPRCVTFRGVIQQVPSMVQ
jgi:hypothetical protein